LESERTADQAEEHLLTTAVSLSKRVKVVQLVIDVAEIIGNQTDLRGLDAGAVAGLVGIEVGVVSGVINLESSGVEASDWRLRHDQAYHEA
jgi:ethanolamine transporter EutH